MSLHHFFISSVTVGVLGWTSLGLAHDTWVETNTPLIRTGDAVHLHLMLGNHGNNHRDFKLASKTTLEGATLVVVGPDGTQYDLRDELRDVGYAPTEGFWTTRFVPRDAGLYLIAHTSDRVVSHGRPVRSRKSGKTCFVAAPLLDRVPRDQTGFDRVCGHPLELVPVVNPVVPMGPGQPIVVRLLWHGRPLPETRISFIPRGTTLGEGFDAQYERLTDAEGQASFTPQFGQVYLVVTHVKAENETGPGYEATTYSATLTVFVPELCPCCGE
jgi:uncharacterized GH25 family protein